MAVDEELDDNEPQPGNVRTPAASGSSIAGGAFVRLLGVAFEDTAPDRARLRLAIRPDLLNSAGALHGGIFATLIDTAIARAVQNTAKSDQPKRATIDLNVTYLRPIRSGTIAVEAWVLRRGRGVVSGEAEAMNDRGELLAKGRATFAVAGDGLDS